MPTTVAAVGTVPPVELGGGRVWHGTVSANDGIYDVVGVNQPSIDGTQTFLQIFSVRAEARAAEMHSTPHPAR